MNYYKQINKNYTFYNIESMILKDENRNIQIYLIIIIYFCNSTYVIEWEYNYCNYIFHYQHWYGFHFLYTLNSQTCCLLLCILTSKLTYLCVFYTFLLSFYNIYHGLRSVFFKIIGWIAFFVLNIFLRTVSYFTHF